MPYIEVMKREILIGVACTFVELIANSLVSTHIFKLTCNRWEKREGERKRAKERKRERNK